MEPVAIEARALTKHFGRVVALDALDLEVPSGHAVGVVGPSGAGKSTLVRILAGLVRPSGGSAAITGIDVAGRNGAAARAALGVAHHGVRFPGWMTGRELLVLVAELAKVARDAVDGQVDAVLETAGLGEVAGRRIATWTEPEQARLGWAQALIGEPAVVLLDDPFAGLDPENERILVRLIAALRERQATVLATTRRKENVRGVDLVVGLDGGRRVELTREEPAPAPAPERVAASDGRAVYVVDLDAGAGLAFAGLVARLRAEPWVAGADADGGSIRIDVDDDTRAGRELLPLITAAGLPVVSYRRVRP